MLGAELMYILSLMHFSFDAVHLKDFSPELYF